LCPGLKRRLGWLTLLTKKQTKPQCEDAFAFSHLTVKVIISGWYQNRKQHPLMLSQLTSWTSAPGPNCLSTNAEQMLSMDLPPNTTRKRKAQRNKGPPLKGSYGLDPAWQI
jgi:hypothetical protein